MLISLFLVVTAFWCKKQSIRFSGILSKCCLFSASIVLSIGFLETLLLFQDSTSSSKALPHAPPILTQYKSNAHILINESILYIPTPNSSYRTFGYSFSTNEFGFRERVFPLKKPKNTFRILVFGDSLTFGVALDNDHRYTNLLEDMLNLQVVNLKFEVLNFGMAGYSTDQEHDLMKAILKIVECDLVVIGFCCDDLRMTTKANLKGFAIVEDTKRLEVKLNGYNIYRNLIRNYKTIPKLAPKDFIKSAEGIY